MRNPLSSSSDGEADASEPTRTEVQRVAAVTIPDPDLTEDPATTTYLQQNAPQQGGIVIANQGGAQHVHRMP